MATRSLRKRLIVANWKMYVASPKEAADFARRLRRSASRFSNVELALAPAAALAPTVAAALKGSSVRLAAQTVSQFESGAHTGEVSAAMLKNIGVSMVLVGHSERRAAGETDDAIAAQLTRAQECKLRAVLCIGERIRDDAGAHFAVLEQQLQRALAPFSGSAAGKSLVIAYEPVWAIGKTAADAMKPEDLRETAIFIRKKLSELLGREIGMKVPVLYGGSVEPDNARALVEKGDVNGFLVGHASAALDSFLSIAEACAA